ncbi:MAG: group II intron reverse transcriptase/maturase, partial [Alphaproteobacteria bacterium]|nr:group II intron reverse transcriptase/maturase [Alphaproteobacteria bacterium]
GVSTQRVSWILDADIAKFFDTIEHDWLVKFIEHRVADARVVRLIKKWLHAGVLEQGRIERSELGTVQGGSISPLLANIYLSILDRHFAAIWERDMSPPWRRQQRRRKGLPNYRLVRFADDFVVLVHGTKSDAEAIKTEIGQLLASRLKMTLSAEKTHITHIDDSFVFLGFRIQRK